MIYNEVAPAGFDYQVLQIQQSLDQLNYIETVFGIARVQLDLIDNKTTQDNYLLTDLGKKGTTKHERWYPQAKKLGSNVDLSIDDSYTSRIFFLVKDPISTSPSEDRWDVADKNPETKQPFSIILHCSLDKIKNLNVGITNTEQVKLGVLYALNQCFNVIVNSMSENIDNVWKEFSMTPEMNGFALPPFYVLRIDADCYYYAFPNNGSLLEYDPSINFGGNTVRIVVGFETITSQAITLVAASPVGVIALSNGDTIPAQYVPNVDGTVTIPYLTSLAGIGLLSTFIITSQTYAGIYVDTNGNVNASRYGGFGTGDIIQFDMRAPKYNSL